VISVIIYELCSIFIDQNSDFYSWALSPFCCVLEQFRSLVLSPVSVLFLHRWSFVSWLPATCFCFRSCQLFVLGFSVFALPREIFFGSGTGSLSPFSRERALFASKSLQGGSFHYFTCADRVLVLRFASRVRTALRFDPLLAALIFPRRDISRCLSFLPVSPRAEASAAALLGLRVAVGSGASRSVSLQVLVKHGQVFLFPVLCLQFPRESSALEVSGTRATVRFFSWCSRARPGTPFSCSPLEVFPFLLRFRSPGLRPCARSSVRGELGGLASICRLFYTADLKFASFPVARAAQDSALSVRFASLPFVCFAGAQLNLCDVHARSFPPRAGCPSAQRSPVRDLILLLLPDSRFRFQISCFVFRLSKLVLLSPVSKSQFLSVLVRLPCRHFVVLFFIIMILFGAFAYTELYFHCDLKLPNPISLINS
jgi:hypothetical protein